MSQLDYIVQDTQTGKKFVWGLRRVLKEINETAPDPWNNYDESDWTQGWTSWIVPLEEYKIVGFVSKTR